MSRILKINSEIQKALGEIISYELKNPQITGIISVTKVDTSADLDNCKVFVSILSTNQTEEDVFNQIKHSAGFIRKMLASKVQLRKTPFLTFVLDKTYEYGKNIDSIIEKISNERKVTQDEDK